MTEKGETPENRGSGDAERTIRTHRALASKSGRCNACVAEGGEVTVIYLQGSNFIHEFRLCDRCGAQLAKQLVELLVV